ncbi:MAG: PEGA domain-containing protein [Candidatus Acidiferrum sp.]
MTKYDTFRWARPCLALFLLASANLAQAQNQVLGEVQLVGKTKAEKTSGVWIDGQYVGYVGELKNDNKVLLLPGEHEISVRQSGYKEFSQKVVVEPKKRVVLHVFMQRDPQARFPEVTSQIKLAVTPERAAVYVDDAFVGSVSEFSGGHAMLVSPAKHHVKIALPGYQDFETEVSLLPRQKITIKTDLIPGTVSQAVSSNKPK